MKINLNDIDTNQKVEYICSNVNVLPQCPNRKYNRCILICECHLKEGLYKLDVRREGENEKGDSELVH